MSTGTTEHAEHPAETPVTIEFLIEPFTEGGPGPHVQAALDVFTARGVTVELGAFASSATGQLDIVAAAVAEALQQAMLAGASNVHFQVRSASALPTPFTPDRRNLHEALPEMLSELETDFGPVTNWDRNTKQAAVRTLSERGAFLLRGAVEEVADVMGVSRITIYNYLNAVE